MTASEPFVSSLIVPSGHLTTTDILHAQAELGHDLESKTLMLTLIPVSGNAVPPYKCKVKPPGDVGVEQKLPR